MTPRANVTSDASEASSDGSSPSAIDTIAHVAYIGIGSNMQNPMQQIKHAYAEVNEIEGTRVIKVSSFYVTAPIGYLAQSDFINAAIKISTTLTPPQLLAALLAIEAKHHRVRTNKNGPRTLDLDILLFDQQQFASPALTLPHPRAHLRAFVLRPLFELSPDLTIPGQGAIRSLLESVENQQIRRLLGDENVADDIAGMDSVSLKNRQTRIDNTPMVNHEI